MDKRVEVAQHIYDYAVEQIAQYCEGSGKSMSEQYSSFLMIANEVSAYLMGNALSVLNDQDVQTELDTFVANTKKVVSYIQAKDKLPKS